MRSLLYVSFLVFALGLTACMGSPEDIGGFQGSMPGPEKQDPLPEVDGPVPGFVISNGAHTATSAGLVLRARTGKVTQASTIISSANLILKTGLERELEDEDTN